MAYETYGEPIGIWPFAGKVRPFGKCERCEYDAPEADRHEPRDADIGRLCWDCDWVVLQQDWEDKANVGEWQRSPVRSQYQNPSCLPSVPVHLPRIFLSVTNTTAQCGQVTEIISTCRHCWPANDAKFPSENISTSPRVIYKFMGRPVDT
eukprot:g36996.t1